MGRADYRRGIAPIRTAAELAALLPVPILLIVEGLACPLFPKSDRSGPSPYVVVIQKKPDPRFSTAGLPIYVHWTQWRDVVAPIVENEATFRWRDKVGVAGDTVTLEKAVVGPDGTTVFPIGFNVGKSAISQARTSPLYSGPDPLTAQYLTAISGIVLRDAVAAGY